MNMYIKKKLVKLLVMSSPVILFFTAISGVIGVLSSENNGEGEMISVEISKSISPDVLKWRPLVEKYAKQFGIPEYVPLILAMIQQESGGNTSLDVMQSAEGAFNKIYPPVPNGITDPDYSICCGVQELKADLTQAGVKSPTDTENLNIALQAYNMGTGYIGYAKSKGGYSLANAKEYSLMMAKQKKWTIYGDPLYVPHVMQYYNVSQYAPEGSNELLNNVVKIALKQQGKAYVYATEGPDTFDCSGLVYYAYKTAGFNHERTSAQGYHNMSQPTNTPQPGDLIFFRKSGANEDHHIGIYLGYNKMIEAPYTGAFVRTTTYLNRPDFVGYGRLKIK